MKCINFIKTGVILLTLSSFNLSAQNVGINSKGNKPSSDAVLDLRTGNLGSSLGFLPNEVSLSATNSASPFTTPDTGLVIYNYVTAGTAPNNVVPGYYYWTGSAWVMMLAPSVGTSGQVLTSNGGGAPTWTTLANTVYSSGTGIKISNDTIINTSPNQTITLSGTGGTTVSGTYPTFTVNSVSPTAYIAGSGIKISNDTISNTQSSGAINYVGTSYLGITSGRGSAGTTEGTSSNLYNINIGDSAGNTTTTAPYCIAIGTGALQNNDKLPNEIAIGRDALNTTYYQGFTGGDVAIGSGAMQSGVTYGNSVAIGYQTQYNTATLAENTSIGYQSLYNGGQNNNSALGYRSLYQTSNLGSFNSALGSGAGYNNINGNYNTFIGYQANASSGGLSNATALGNNALVDSSNTITLGNNSVVSLEMNGALKPYYSGSYNAGTSGQVLTSQGSDAAPKWVTPTVNTYIGGTGIKISNDTISNTQSSGAINFVGTSYLGITSGAGSTGTSEGLSRNLNNIDIGVNAGNGCSTGTNNIALGNQSLYNTGSGLENIGLGDHSLSNNIGGNYNIATGFYALGTNSNIGSYNSATGYQVMQNAAGSYNIANGYQALQNGNASYNIAFGDSSMANGSNSGEFNIAMGSQSLYNNSSGAYNIATGFQSLYNNTSGTYNLASGNNALYNNSSGSFNIALGDSAIGESNTGMLNIAIGSQALFNNGSGSNNIAIGNNALRDNANESGNIVIGAGALSTRSTGGGYAGDVVIGYQASGMDLSNNDVVVGYQAESDAYGGNSVAVGYQALYNTGENNTGVGYQAGKTNTGTYNTFLGYSADAATSTTYTNVTAIGYNAKVSASNTMVFGNNSVTATEFNGALMPYYSSAYNAGTSGQILESKGAGAAPQWVTPSFGTVTGSGTATQVAFWSGSSALSSNSNLYWDNTNSRLGIGTSSPNAALHTIASGAKTAAYSGNLLTNTATSSTASIMKAGVEIQSNGSWNGTSASNIGLYVSSVTGGTNNYDAIFNGGGNVGIGTTSPTAILHTVASGAKTAAYSGNLLTNTATSSTASIKKAALELQSTGSWTGTSASNIGLYVSSTTGGTNNYDAIFNGGGNVGIGTTSPTAILHTVASGAKTAAYSGNLLTNTATSGTASITKAGLEIQSTGSWTGTSATNIGLYVSSTTGGTNNYDAIFNGGGNVGIGTSSPQAPLEVYSANYLMLDAEGSGTTGTWLRLNNTSTGGTTWNLISTGSANSEGAANLLFNANGSDKMTIQSSTGDVGIGTSSPTTLLYVTGTTSSGGYIATVANTTNASNSPSNGINILAGANSYTSGSTNFVSCKTPNGTQIGSINQSSTTSVSFNTTSDERLKENIIPTKYGINDLMKIQIKDYTYKGDNGQNQQTGYLAQQLNTVFPNAVHIGGDDPKTNPWMVDYGRITPLLVKSIQDQQQIIDEQNKKLDSYQQQMTAQQQQIDELKKMVEQIANSKK